MDDHEYSAPKYTISDAFRMYCIRTNGHGWFRIVRARSFCGMIFWFLLTLICFSIGVGVTIDRWTKFSKYDTDAPVGIQIGGLKYPYVTVCSPNPIKKSKMTLDGNVELDNYRNNVNYAQINMNKTFKDLVFHKEKLKGEYLDVHVEAYKNLVAARDNGTNVTVWQQFGYDLSELVLYCKIGNEDCMASFQFVYDYVYGNCYTLKSGSQDALAGTKNGIRLVLNTSTAEFLPWYTETDGGKLIIHERGTMPLSDQAYSLVSSQHNQFAMQQEQSHRLEAPYNDPPCENDYNDFSQLFGYTYSFTGCQATCLQRKVIADCGCSDPRQPASSVRWCQRHNRSMEGYCMDITPNEIAKALQQFCKCPLPCHETTYHITTSFTHWPSPQFDFASKYPAFSSSETTSVLLYFQSVAVTTYQEIPRENTWQFLGWIGGQLYAWCGASMVTAFEFLLFLLTAILVLFTENVDWALDGCNNIR